MGILELVLLGGGDKKEEEAEMEGDLAASSPIPNLSSVASLVIRRCSRLISRLSFLLLDHLLPFCIPPFVWGKMYSLQRPS